MTLFDRKTVLSQKIFDIGNIRVEFPYQNRKFAERKIRVCKIDQSFQLCVIF